MAIKTLVRTRKIIKNCQIAAMTLVSMKKTQIVIFLMPKCCPDQIEIKADNFLPALTIVFNERQSKLWPKQKKNHKIKFNISCNEENSLSDS